MSDLRERVEALAEFFQQQGEPLDGGWVALQLRALLAPRAEEPGLREALSKWFEQPVENHLRLDWETGYRCARDEVRDMVDDALSSTHLGQMKEKEA